MTTIAAPRLSPPSAIATPSRSAAPPTDPPQPKHDITVKQAVEALSAAVVDAGVEAVGNTAVSIGRMPQAVYQGYKTLYNTQQIGPVLKTAIGLTLPVGVVAIPAFTLLGSIGFGLFRGFSEALNGGFVHAVKQGAQDVKDFNTNVAGKGIEAMKEVETEPLPPGQKPYDIRVIDAAKGLAGGAAGAVIDGAGIGLVTLARTPQGVYKTYKDIWKSDQGPVLRTTESLLVPIAAVVATPLATVGGVLYGLVSGFSEGYQHGLGSSLHKTSHTVKDFSDAVSDWLKSE